MLTQELELLEEAPLRLGARCCSWPSDTAIPVCRAAVAVDVKGRRVGAALRDSAGAALRCAAVRKLPCMVLWLAVKEVEKEGVRLDAGQSTFLNRWLQGSRKDRTWLDRRRGGAEMPLLRSL